MSHQKSGEWYRLMAAAATRHLLMKSLGTTLFIGVFFVAYFYLLKNPAYPTSIMPFTWVDRMIPFQPLALPLYFSLWLYVSLPLGLLSTRREMYGYGLAMATTCLVGLVFFYFWPTVVPAANIDWARYPNVIFLKDLDASGNACPSLHVTTAIFSGICLHQVLRRFGTPTWLLIFNILWCAGIIYSTLATRQHVAVDVLAGLALGSLAAYLSLRLGILSGAGNHPSAPPT
ncbi:phosphatase PAP2 family protein [Pseudomonadota bacterium]